MKAVEYATNEESTKRFLIESFMRDILGIDTRDPTKIAYEFTIQDRKGGTRPDYVLKRGGRAWCVVEAKKYGSPWVGGKVHTGSKEGWQQLDGYSRSRELRGAEYFLLTDGKWWHWFVKEEGYLAEKPFLTHDVSSPSTVAAVIYCGAVLKGSMGDLQGTVVRTAFAATARDWLRSLNSTEGSLLDQLLEIGAFRTLWNDHGIVPRKTDAREHLQAVWSAVLREYVRQLSGGDSIEVREPPIVGPLPGGSLSPYACKWRLNTDAEWENAGSAGKMMVAVLKRLGELHPDGRAAWFASIRQRKPKLVNLEKSGEAQSWKRRISLGSGYSCETNLSNLAKEKLLSFCLREFARVSDDALQLEWEYLKNSLGASKVS